MSRSRRSKLPWRQRPRAWLNGWLYHWFGTEEEQELTDEDPELTDDHGNHIGDLVDDYQYGPPVIRTTRLGRNVYVPLSGGQPVNPWAPPAFTPEQPRPETRSVATGEARSLSHAPGNLAQVGPGHLTMWDIRACRDPWPPRPWPVTWSPPRLCAGRITLLAGA